jgi:hypothetical protein
MTARELSRWLASLPPDEGDFVVGFYDEWGYQEVREIQVRGRSADGRYPGSICLSELQPDAGQPPITKFRPEVDT